VRVATFQLITAVSAQVSLFWCFDATLAFR